MEREGETEREQEYKIKRYSILWFTPHKAELCLGLPHVWFDLKQSSWNSNWQTHDTINMGDSLTRCMTLLFLGIIKSSYLR